MAMMAKEAFPFLLLQTFGTAAAAALEPLCLHYRAQLLESMIDTEGFVFWDTAKALILMELLTTMLVLLTSMVKVHAETLANKEIQIAY